ncbi:hypothetical protein AHAS_Ahas20G0232400 [Arachis hypogaea]|uniref:Uncharacterized protein n=1 Tax=Arachis hypogaea TaxID=3818 RepID=A0A444X561_ARAHY|nr:hypothetical protein Ahy_B10g104290 [Arachis hypogaea]
MEMVVEGEARMRATIVVYYDLSLPKRPAGASTSHGGVTETDVWQDLTENDFIYTTNGHDEYVLKGTLLIQPSHTLTSFDDTLSSDVDHADSSSSSTTAVKVYQANACTNATNASTQTDNRNQLDAVSDNNDGISISISCSGSGFGDIRNQKMGCEHQICINL